MEEILEDTKTDNNPVKPFSWDTVEPDKELDNILSAYKEPLKTETGENNAPVSAPVSTVENPLPIPEDKTDKRFYYQSGKKAGQRKPDHLIKKTLETKGVTYNPPASGTSINASFITGALAIAVIDLMLPLIIGGINNTFTKVKVDQKVLELTSSQKKNLEPIWDAALKYIQIRGNPMVLAILCTMGLYLTNFFLMRSAAKMQMKMKENQNTK